MSKRHCIEAQSLDKHTYRQVDIQAEQLILLRHLYSIIYYDLWYAKLMYTTFSPIVALASVTCILVNINFLLSYNAYRF